MKKSISEDKVKRMRNIVSGEYSSKTKIRSGYTKKRVVRKEGDVWVESKKTWTIKNGIKQTVNKLDKVRKENAFPLCCPSCSKSMKYYDKKAYAFFKFCSNCLVDFESKIQKEGKWAEYKKEVQDANFKSWLNEAKEEYSDFIKSRNSKHYISEAGDIEDWGSGQSEEELKKIFEKQIEKAIEDRNVNN